MSQPAVPCVSCCGDQRQKCLPGISSWHFRGFGCLDWANWKAEIMLVLLRSW